MFLLERTFRASTFTFIRLFSSSASFASRNPAVVMSVIGYTSVVFAISTLLYAYGVIAHNPLYLFVWSICAPGLLVFATCQYRFAKIILQQIVTAVGNRVINID
jgi:hypothetical protein